MNEKIIASLRRNYNCRQLEKRAPGMFDRIVALDPSPDNEFTRWLFSLYFEEKLKEEDFYKAPLYLKAFLEHRHELGSRNEVEDYDDLPKLFEAIRKFLPESNRTLSADYVKSLAIHIVYQSDALEILSPCDEEAAKFLGRNTQWCTAAQGENQFEYYNKSGPLLVVREKGGRRYQLHFPTLSFRDETDNEIEIWGLLNTHPVLKQIAAWHVAEKYPGPAVDLFLGYYPTRAAAMAALDGDYRLLNILPMGLAHNLDVKDDWTRVAPDMPEGLQRIALDSLVKKNLKVREMIVEGNGEDAEPEEPDGEALWSLEEETELLTSRLSRAEDLKENEEKLRADLLRFARILGAQIAPQIAFRILELYPKLAEKMPELGTLLSTMEVQPHLKSYIDLRRHVNASAKMQQAARELAASALQKTATAAPQYLGSTYEGIRSAFSRLAQPTKETAAWLEALDRNQPQILAGKTECIPR